MLSSACAQPNGIGADSLRPGLQAGGSVDALTRAAAWTYVAPASWHLSGCWTVLGIGELARKSPTIEATMCPGPMMIDGSKVEALDTVGAMLIDDWLLKPGLKPGAAREVEWRGWTPAHARLIQRLQDTVDLTLAQPPLPPSGLTQIGMSALALGEESMAILRLVGECGQAWSAALTQPSRMRWRALLHHVAVAGIGALPIAGMLSLLMGVVVAYQGSNQLSRYGANLYIVDLVGVSMLREFAPLVTAIIVCGRSGAAFAAQLGSMVVTEEIDAMRTLGLSPVEQLVLPRLLALLVALPLLTLFADVLGVLGGMLMARASLNVDYGAFIERLPIALTLGTLLVGIAKAPIFAALIAVTGCAQGLRTSAGADAVGRQTTRAVVQAIFLVIVADALFSVALSMLDL